MYMVTIAARMSSNSLASDARNASAAPWKLVRTESGSSSALASASIAPTAAPSEAPGARLKEMVAAGNWPRWFTASSAGFSVTLVIARHVGELRQLPEAIDQAVHRRGELVRIRVLDGELVLGAADAVLDGEVLHRLHVEGDALDLRDPRLQPPHDLRDVGAALGPGLQVDEHAAVVERGVDAVHADERGDAFHGGVLQDRLGQGALALGHRGERDRLRRLGDSLDDARVLQREEALRHDRIENHAECERADENPQ